MAKPTIIVGCGSGYHNENLEAAIERLQKAELYRDLSTTILMPTRGTIPALVVQSWQFLQTPSNQAVGRMFSQGMEVASAYNHGIQTVQDDPQIGKFKYILTLEDDNIPPHDGLLKLLENICSCDVPCKEHFTVVGGLYFTKGEEGIPMIWGDASKIEEGISFPPQIPIPDSVQECNGVGMGFTLWHGGLFKLDEVPFPWFKTHNEFVNNERYEHVTQDLWFMKKLRELGYRIACDTSIKVGHFDRETEMVW